MSNPLLHLLSVTFVIFGASAASDIPNLICLWAQNKTRLPEEAMKALRSVLLMWALAVVSGTSFGENAPLSPELLRALTTAKTVYLVSGHVRFPKTKDLIKTEWVDSTPFEEPLHKEFEKWGRFTLASDAKSADLIVRAYMTGSTESVPVFTPGVTGSVTVGSTFIVLDVVQPSSGKILWSASKASGRSWSTKTAVSGLVKNFRKFLEQQETAHDSEASQVSVANVGSSSTPAQCVGFDKVNSQSTPPELYRMIGQCIQSNDYASSVALFLLAGMDVHFDLSRVADNTVGDTGNVLIMNTFESIPAAEKKKFGSAIQKVSADNSVMGYLCGWAQEVGPPTYYPTYMIMHGMNAVTSGLTKTPLQQEVLPVPDASGKWKSIGTSYAHCTLAELSAPPQDAQATERYRETIERATAESSTAPTVALPTKVNSSDGLMYVWIAPGRFQMGCSPDDSQCAGPEKPSHSVTITKGFWIGQTLVTQAAYQHVTGTNPSRFKGDQRPVEMVTWLQANSYCSAVGMRLPTEAEWEYAARAGNAGSRYGELNSIAWYQANGAAQTHDVAQKQPNQWKLFDMLGNVWEWTADWYDANYYSQSPSQDPQGPSAGQYRVLRGGSWFYPAGFARVSFRNYFDPALKSMQGGFRCAGEALR